MRSTPRSTSMPGHTPSPRREDEPFFAVRRRIAPTTVATVVLVGLVVVVVSAAIAWDGTVPAWEESVVRWTVGWPDLLEPVMLALQQVGVLMTPVIAGVVIVWFTRRWTHLLAFALILPLKLGLEKAIVKQLVDRERPHTSIGPDIVVRGPQLEGLSFPSGHVTTATATAVLLVAFLPPKWRPLPLAWAAVVAVARLYLGEHNPLDVVAGAALGVSFAVVLWWAFLNRDVVDREFVDDREFAG